MFELWAKMDYTKLDVWQLSRQLANTIYEVTSTFPKEEIFGLTSQMRRAAISVPSNIAEGCGRRSIKETIRFLYIARGSLYEIETQIYLASDRVYIKKEEFEKIGKSILICKKVLNGFINRYQQLI